MSAINDAGASPASPSSPPVQTLGPPTVAEAAPVARLLLDDAELQAQYAACKAELAAWETAEKEKAADAAYQELLRQYKRLKNRRRGTARSSAAEAPPATAAARRRRRRRRRRGAAGDDGPTFTDEEIEQAQALFKSHDANGDGVLDIEEFTSLMNALSASAGSRRQSRRFTAVDINSYFRQADADASGTLDFHEFLHIQRKRRRMKGIMRGVGLVVAEGEKRKSLSERRVGPLGAAGGAAQCPGDPRGHDPRRRRPTARPRRPA